MEQKGYPATVITVTFPGKPKANPQEEEKKQSGNSNLS